MDTLIGGGDWDWGRFNLSCLVFIGVMGIAGNIWAIVYADSGLEKDID